MMVNVNWKKAGIRIVIWGALLGGLYGLYLHPEVINRAKEIYESVQASGSERKKEKDVIANLNMQVAKMQQEIIYLDSKMKGQQSTIDTINVDNSAFTQLGEKFDNLSKQTLTIIDAKADNAAVLGLVMRMDGAEAKLAKIANVSNKGALIMTAVMLVKDRADRGDKFIYEAEILQLLAADEARIKEAVDVIASKAFKGTKKESELQQAFLKMYEVAEPVAEPKDIRSWKERLVAKFNELVQIKKVDEPAKEVKPEVVVEKDVLREYVENGQIIAAVDYLSNPENKVRLEDRDLNDWFILAKDKVEFDRAISLISAYNLALMKVNALSEQ